jgi:hypothetical protein
MPSRIFVQHAVHDGQWVRAQEVHHHRAGEAAHVVDADGWRLATIENFVHTGVIGDQLFDSRRQREHPTHLADEPDRRMTAGGVIAHHKFEVRHHPVLIEDAPFEVSVTPRSDLEHIGVALGLLLAQRLSTLAVDYHPREHPRVETQRALDCLRSPSNRRLHGAVCAGAG